MTIGSIKNAFANHSAEIISGVAVIGVALTGYLAFKAGYDTCAELSEMPEDISGKDKAKVVIKNSWGAITTGVLTEAMIISSGVIAYRRNKALGTVTSAYVALSEMSDTYRRHALEHMGEKKEGEMRGEIAEEQMQKYWPGGKDLIENTGHGNHIFMDGLTKKFFLSDLDYIRQQQVRLNNWFDSGEDEVDFTQWCAALDVDCNEDLAIFVWTAEQRIDFELETCLAPNGEPAYYLDYDAKCIGNEMRLSDRIAKVY